MPSWNDFVNHPNYDEFWKRQAVTPYLKKVTVPNLNVAGWWDQEDFYGPQKIYEALEKHDSRHWNYFVAGPWNHGGWARRRGKLAGQDRVWQRHQQVLSRENPGRVVRLLAEGRRATALPGSDDLRDRNQSMEDLRASGRRGRASSRASSISRRAGAFPLTRPAMTARRDSTATSPTPRTPCPTAISPSSPPTPAVDGLPGWWKISGSSRTGPMS